jgi:hypothetical protein
MGFFSSLEILSVDSLLLSINAPKITIYRMIHLKRQHAQRRRVYSIKMGKLGRKDRK